MNVLQAHTRVVLGLLDADNVAPPLVVLNGKAAKGQALPYVLVYFRLRTPAGREVPAHVGLEATSDVIDVAAYCHSVGGSQDAALGVAGRVRACLLGVSPAVTGRLCYPIAHADAAPAVRSEETGVDVYDLADVYEFRSTPA